MTPEIIDNPCRAREYFVICKNDFTLAGAGKISVDVTFIPDSAILNRQSYNAYLENIFAGAGGDLILETLAEKIIEDLSNELVPFWISVRILLESQSGNSSSLHQAILEDRQPGWDNPGLLSQVGPPR